MEPATTEGSMMIGTSLVEMREHIDALTSMDGGFLIRCGRTGDRPVPIAGRRFENRATARNAARVAEQYRAALRRYDPQVPHRDLVVCQGMEGEVSATPDRRKSTGHPPSRPPSVESSNRPEGRELVEFCHTVAAAVFETLSAERFDAVETAVMDTYFELAETAASPDGLCLRLLESMAAELDRTLSPGEQQDVLASAAARLPSADASDSPVSATLSELRTRGVVGDDSRSTWSGNREDGIRSVVVHLSGYALSPQHGRLPMLPFVLELYRYQFDWSPSSLEAVDAGDEWRVTLARESEGEPSGLVSAPIVPEG